MKKIYTTAINNLIKGLKMRHVIAASVSLLRNISVYSADILISYIKRRAILPYCITSPHTCDGVGCSTHFVTVFD